MSMAYQSSQALLSWRKMRVQGQLPHLDKHMRDMYHKGKPTWCSHTRVPVSMFHKVLQSCAVWSIYIDPLGGVKAKSNVSWWRGVSVLMQSPERAHHNFNAFATVVVTTVVPVVPNEGTCDGTCLMLQCEKAFLRAHLPRFCRAVT